MRSLFLLVFCAAAALLPLLPYSEATCADHVETCVNETAAQPMGTVDEKCRYVFMFKECLENKTECKNATAEVSAKKTNLSNPVCLEDGCSQATPCQGASQTCTADKCSCMAAYKFDKGICVGKVVGDNCMAGNDSTCGTSQTCNGAATEAKCKCKMAFKETDRKTCTAKVVDDPCTQGQNASCGENLMCAGTSSDAKCACVTGFLANDAKVCMAKKLNDSCDTAVTDDCGHNLTCTAGKCACKAGHGDNGEGMCAQSCAPSFKGDVGSCMPKTVGDNCTTGQNHTCSTGTYCKGDTCACPEGLKDDGTRNCSTQCAATFGDDGRGQCSQSCAKGMKGVVAHCVEVQVHDNCTAGDDLTCGMYQSCNGTGENATCVCQEGYVVGTNRLCSAMQTDSSGRVVLSLSLHLIPIVLVMIICKWM